MEITREWLDRLADSASQHPSDADVILDLKVSVEAMCMQGALSEKESQCLASRLGIIAKRLIATGDVFDEGLAVAAGVWDSLVLEQQDRPLVEAEWRSLLANPVFMAELIVGIGRMLETTPAPGEFLLIKNWPKSAHEELLTMLPEHLAGSFDLSAFRPDGAWPYLDETEGLRILSAGVVAGPAGCDESRFTPHGEHPLSRSKSRGFLERTTYA